MRAGREIHRRAFWGWNQNRQSVDIPLLGCRSIQLKGMGIRLLASLLPGLRDVRVPLTVGYLWFFNLWLWFSDNVPRTSPSGDGLISRAFELEEILGFASTIGAVSFCAYLLGLMA